MYKYDSIRYTVLRIPFAYFKLYFQFSALTSFKSDSGAADILESNMYQKEVVKQIRTPIYKLLSCRVIGYDITDFFINGPH